MAIEVVESGGVIQLLINGGACMTNG